MQSRRSFIGAAVGTTGLLAGCIGQLGSSDDSNSDGDSNDGGNEGPPYAKPSVSISVWGQVDGNEVGVTAVTADAETIIIEQDGQEISQIEQNTDGEKIVAEDVEEGAYFEATAVYPNGDRESVVDRCYDCE